jgi:hypothetical protein
MSASAQVLPTNSTSNDTLNTKIVPVVVVPGVMGTRVSMVGTGSPDWDPDNNAQMLQWANTDSIAKQRFLDPTSSDGKGTVMQEFSDLARGALRSSDLATVAARDRPSVVPPKVTGRSNATAIADAEFLKFYKERGWPGATWKFYGDLLLRLEKNLNSAKGRSGGTLLNPVYASGYDWRKSNIENGARLSTEIDRILARHPNAKQVLVVTHSMGGLVTRASLAGSESKILGVIHCVIPTDGAAVAYRRFHSGATLPFDAPQNEDPPILEAVAARVLNKIMGPDAVGYALVQSVLRGPVELLPSNDYRTVFVETTNFGTNLDMGDVYRIYALDGPPGILPKIGASNVEGFTWNANDAAALRARIAGAKTLQATLGRRYHPNTVVLFGDDLRTDTNFNWNAGVVDQVDGIEDLKLKINQGGIDPNPDSPGKFLRGDGTVPAVSARVPSAPAGSPRVGISGAEHSVCFAKKEFMDQVEFFARKLLGF